MKLKVVLPSGVLLDQEVVKVVAEAENGSFCLLPRHVDFVAALVPGILAFTPAQGDEAFLATDEGVLVKCGARHSKIKCILFLINPVLGRVRLLARPPSRDISSAG